MPRYPCSAIPAEAEETVGTLARLYDLTVALQPESSPFSCDNIIPQGILFNSGGPMLMVPYIHKGPLDARHVGVAWDGSRLAARALRDAMPFLAVAQTVTVIAVKQGQDAGEASSDRIVSHLARRGIQARMERLTADRGNVHGHHPVAGGRQRYRHAGDGRVWSLAVARANSRWHHTRHVRPNDGNGADVALIGARRARWNSLPPTMPASSPVRPCRSTAGSTWLDFVSARAVARI